MKKRLLSMLLVICMLVSVLPMVSLTAFAAAGDVPTTMSVEPTADNNIPAAITLYKTSTSGGGGGWNPGGGGGWGFPGGGGGGSTSSTNNFALFLPGNAVVSKCFLSWADGLEATYNGKTYASGTLPIPAPGSKGTVTFTKNGATTTFEITTYQGSKNVPATFIVIDESQGTISAMNNDQKHETECVGVMFVDGEEFEMPKIKGRGNYTWTSAVQKKSYNITLAKKTNLLGIECDATKKWSVLGNIDDHSLMRDQLAYGMAYDMGIGLDNAQTDIWMNGEYQGTYLMTPKYDSFVTDDGYLLEHDNKTEDSIEKGGDPQFTLSGLNDRISVKKVGANLLGEETPENLAAARDTIKAYMADVWEAMNASNGKNSKGKYYADYLDMESWAKFWLMQEYIKDYDIAAGSKMFSREGTAETDLLFAGPLWDCGNALGRTQNNPALGSAADETNGYGWYIQKVNGTSLYKSLAKHEDFMDLVYKVYTRNKKTFDDAPAKVEAYAKAIEDSAAMNFVKVTRETYETCNVGRAMTKEAGTKYEQQYKQTSSWSDYVHNLTQFVTARSKFFADNMTVEGELDPGFRATFKVGKNANVTVYDTQDTTAGGTTNLNDIFAKNSATGEIDISGEGQVNFKVEMKDGYSLVGVTAEPAENFKNLKNPVELGADGVYRLTKVTGPVTITVETAEVVCDHEFDENGKCALCGAQAYKATFKCDEHCSITSYLTQDLTTGGTPNAKTAFARASTDGSIDISGEGQIGFIVNLDEGYEVAEITAEPANFKNFKLPEETGTPGYYRLTKVRGDVTVTVKTREQGASTNIDFTKADDASKFEVVNQKNAKVTEGTGVKLTATRPAFEDCNGQNTGDNGKNPEDVIKVPVAGDWTATLSFDFSTGSAQNGYYQFFGFYAGQGEGYQDLAGIRGGDGAMQDFLRKGGTVTAETKNSTPGLASAGSYWYQIKKAGTTYTCLRSSDGENFTEMFSFADTGIEADSIYIDAYTGMTEGYEFTLKSLDIEVEGGSTPDEPDEPEEPEDPFVATFVCDKHCSVTTYETQAQAGAVEKATSAFARDSVTGAIDVSGSGQVNFVVVPDAGYEVESVVAEPAESYKNLKAPDETLVENGYRITKIVGDFTVTVTTKKSETTPDEPDEPGTSATIDFTKAADASKFDILNKKNAAVAEGSGLKLTATRPAFEDCNGQNTGDQATNPEDVISVPVSGDWTATLNFDFSTGSAANGYYQFFGFYAAQGNDYQNLAGIRGGDGAMQNFTRIAGTIDADNNNSEPGLASNGSYWYQIKKEGSTYTCLRSADGKEFTEMFSYADTGIEADKLLIDAYTGMTEGYEFNLKSLTIEGAGVIDDPVKPFVATFNCDANCSVTVYNTQVLENGTENAASAPARDSATGEIDATGNGQVNFVVVPADGYEVESVTAEPANYKNIKGPDETGVENYYRITKITDDFTVTVTTKKAEDEPVIPDGHYIDFTKTEDASKYEIDFKASAAVTEGEGLKFSSSTANFEASGDPSDVIKIPMSGNWVATFKFTAVPGSTMAWGGDTDLLGIYLMDDYQNGVGMRAGNSSIVNFVRKDGVVTTDTAAYGAAIGAGFTTNATNWFRIEKAGTDVICYVSTDGEDFTEAFVIDNTGLEGKMLVIDAYKNTSWSFGGNNAYTFEYMDLVPITGPIVKPEIKSISVDGKKIDFDPAVKAYNVEVSKDAAKAPVITVEAGNDSTKIDIQQLTGPFGTAYVTASAGTRALKYSLSFNYGPQDDYFADGDMSDNWTILHEVKDPTEERPWTYYRFEEGTGLVLPTQKGSIYMAKQADPQGPWTNVFVMPAQGDWEIVTKSFYPQLPKDIYQQTQVFAWQDEDNYIRINCQYNAQQNLRVEPAAEIGSGTFNILDVTYATANADGTATLYYKVKKEGTTYTVSYSTDCKNWVAGGKVENLNYIDPKFGLFCTQDDGNDNYIELSFEYVAVTSRNGEVVRTDAQVLEWAAQQAAAYMAAGLPAATTEKLSVKAPHGYSVEFVSSNPAVIAADGTVTPGKDTANVQVSVKVTEGDTTATSAPVTIKVAGTESGECAHEYTKVVTPATCTADGYTTYTCSKCGDTYKADEVKALGHDYKAVVTAPTCTAKGYTTYTCSRCADSYKADETAALGHDYKAVVTAPTCTKDGYTTYTCARCGDSYKGNEVKALGHDWDEGKVTVEPTETTKGTKVFTCTRCGETKEESIPEKGHEHKYTAVVTAPTCTEAGYTTYTCDCGDSYKADEVPALGHKFENGKCTRCGADDPDWHETKECPSEKYEDAPAKGNWAHEGIDFCIAEGYMNGMNETTFKPQGTVTRGQLVTIIYRVAESPEVEFKGIFEDVKDGKFYSKAVEWAAAEGVVTGKTATKFAPEEAITREQIAAILYRYKGSPEIEADLSQFPDADDASNYAKKALTWAVKEGLINGVKGADATTLSPKANATRAQIAAIIMRFLDGEYKCGE